MKCPVFGKEYFLISRTGPFSSVIILDSLSFAAFFRGERRREGSWEVESLLRPLGPLFSISWEG
jgi:hypothetical protein